MKNQTEIEVIEEGGEYHIVSQTPVITYKTEVLGRFPKLEMAEMVANILRKSPKAEPELPKIKDLRGGNRHWASDEEKQRAWRLVREEGLQYRQAGRVMKRSDSAVREWVLKIDARRKANGAHKQAEERILAEAAKEHIQ